MFHSLINLSQESPHIQILLDGAKKLPNVLNSSGSNDYSEKHCSAMLYDFHILQMSMQIPLPVASSMQTLPEELIPDFFNDNLDQTLTFINDQLFELVHSIFKTLRLPAKNHHVPSHIQNLNTLKLVKYLESIFYYCPLSISELFASIHAHNKNQEEYLTYFPFSLDQFYSYLTYSVQSTNFDHSLKIEKRLVYFLLSSCSNFFISIYKKKKITISFLS